MMGSHRIARWLLSALIVLTVPVMTGCGIGQSEEQQVAESFAEEIAVDGFERKADFRERSEMDGLIVAYLGDSKLDLRRAVRGPNLVMRPPEDFYDTDELFKLVAQGEVDEYRGLWCEVFVGRLRDGVEPLDSHRLSEDEKSEVRTGRLTVVEITILCNEQSTRISTP